MQKLNQNNGVTKYISPKKYILVVAILSIVPSIALASWWNPTSWNIFSFIFHTNPQVQIISTTTPDQTLTDNSTTTATTTISIATTTEVAVATTSTPQIDTPIKKVVPPVTTQLNSCPTGYSLNSDNTSCVTPAAACSEINGNWDGKIANSEADCTCRPGYVPDNAGTTCQLSNTSGSSQTALSPWDCNAEGTTEGYKILIAAQTADRSTLAVGEEQAQAGAQESADLLNYTKALGTLCNTSLSTDRTNSKLSQLENQLQQAVLTSQQQQEQIQGLQRAQTTLATPGASNPLNALYQGAGYNTSAIQNNISHIYQPAISAIQSQQQPVIDQSKTDMYGAVFAALDGTTIYVNNGGTYTRSGNNIYGPNGASYVISGSTIYGPGGTSYVLDGATLYGPNGTTYTQSGNTISGSDGSSATAVGNTIYVKSGN